MQVGVQLGSRMSTCGMYIFAAINGFTFSFSLVVDPAWPWGEAGEAVAYS